MLTSKKIKKLLWMARFLNRHHDWTVQDLHHKIQVDFQSRRQFLIDTAKAGLLAAPATQLLTAACAHAPLSQSSVTIVGGGIAGLSAAFALTQAGIRCEIFEATPRLGGRMYTKTNFNDEGMTCELGGELVDSDHEDLMQMCAFFDIAVDDFRPADRGLEQNLYYFANSSGGPRQYYTDRDAIEALRVFDRRFAADVESLKTTEGLRKFDQMNLQEYLDSYRGEADRWFLEMLRIAFVGQSAIEADEQSSLGMIFSVDPDPSQGFKLYGDSDESHRIRGGNQALISAMTKWLQDHHVPIHLGSPLQAIRETARGLALTFAGKTINADCMICTIPFSVLRHVDGFFALDMSDLKKAAIKEKVYGTSGKRIYGFKKKIWRAELHKHGHKIPASNGMVYTDLIVQNLWETSRVQPNPYHPGVAGILTAYLGGHDGTNVDRLPKSRFLHAIEDIFPGTRAQFDGHEAYFNWTHFPYALGSYGTLAPGQYSRFGKIAEQPELNGKLIFAGEHVAPKFKGFMNGACLSGKFAAQTVRRMTR